MHSLRARFRETGLLNNLWSEEHVVAKGDANLHVYRRCRTRPVREKERPVLVLVHGSSFGALASYDLKVPGKSGYSMLDVCAGFDLDVWAIDHEGYGQSTRTQSFSDFESCTQDLSIVADLIERETGWSSAAYYGQSAGSLRAAHFAQRYPSRVERLVLDAFVWTGEGSTALAKRREGLASYMASHRRSVTRESLKGALLKDDPHHTTVEPGVADALADAALRDGDSVPSGSFVEMCTKLPLVDPEKIECPVCLLRGESDSIAHIDDLLRFYLQLRTNDKHLSMMPESGHIAHLSRHRDRFYQLLRNFLALPPVAAHHA